jgi:hypothetical protein
MANTIAVFQISTDEDFRFQYVWTNLNLTGRALRILVKERATNTIRATLTTGSGLTLTGTDTVTATVAQATSSAWPRGEYEVDLHDITAGANLRLVGGRAIFDHPGNLVHGVRGNSASITWANNQAIVTGVGGVGPAGPANSLAIGTVTTGAAGSSASATITGASPNQTLNLTIPRGNTGAPNSLAIGTVTTGAAGSSASATITGTAPSQTLSLTIPRGNTGLTGDTGPANSLAIGTVTTGAPGSGASATITGTAPSQTLSLTIPRGDQGPSGSVTDGTKGDIVVSGSGSVWTIGSAYSAQWMPKTGGTLTGDITISRTNPVINFQNTSGTANNTRARIVNTLDTFVLQSRNDDNSAKATLLNFNLATGVGTFFTRPMFNANTPWDSGNFDPADYAARTGASFSGNISINKATPTLWLNSTDGSSNQIVGQMSASIRWIIRPGNNVAESGSNVGSNFDILRYSDAGALLGAALTIARNTGVATFSARPTFNGATPLDTANDPPADGKQYARKDNGWEEIASGRQVLMNAINGAKALTERQGIIDGYAEGFGSNDGINAGASSGYSYDASNKRIMNGVSAGAMISAAAGSNIGNMTADGGLAAAFDGNLNQDFGACCTRVAANGYVGKNDSAAPKTVGSAIVYSGTNGFDGVSTANTITISLYGKASAPASGTDGTLLGSVTLSGETNVYQSVEIPSSNTTTAWAYRWIYITTTQATSPQVNISEVRFYSPDTYANIILAETGYDTLDFVPATLKATAVIEPIDAATLGTDVTMEVSRNNGATWTAAALTQIQTLGTKRLVESASISVTGQSSGSKPAFRFRTFNGKRVYLHGAAIVGAA